MNRTTNNGGFFADCVDFKSITHPKEKKENIILKFEMVNVQKNVC